MRDMSEEHILMRGKKEKKKTAFEHINEACALPLCYYQLPLGAINLNLELTCRTIFSHSYECRGPARDTVPLVVELTETWSPFACLETLKGSALEQEFS